MKNTPSTFMISIVKDMDKSIEFYRDKMGMKVLDRTDKWTELSFSDQLALALHKVDDEKSFHPAGIGFQVDDCEEATKHYESLGVKIDNRCEHRGNIILTQFGDPDGNVIWLSQHLK
jgi:catechol 2,3-dioxygenase-like lactoylglutathione lyase family enzyme